ncbi:8926_t:CDS:1 [Cetraspora pellucida]|uniref:8926_t:CDS:1 n=1 Tax=Cetraspora pellucida TaxID=1433469 RepID=A0ACA9KN95_9GLOM|nr:8926_t:CDS:1 [Cetraspora pellucida]
MQATNTSRSTQILAQNIKLNNELKPHIPVKEILTQRFKNQRIHAVSVDFDNSKTTVLKDSTFYDGFVAAIFHAYNNHQHLRLSPDDIWLTIAQGVSRHINYNAEKFRSRFVNHEGKKDIIVLGADILYETSHNTLEGNWPEMLNRFVAKVDECVEKIDLAELLVCDFSTTTTNSLTASRIVLLDTVKAYFKYIAMLVCGIPKVTLEGTLEDWIKIQERVIQLRKLNLELDFWLDRLEPVIQNLVSTYRGEIDEDFWSKIMNVNVSYGSGGDSLSTVTGWILGFFPYNREGTAIRKNGLGLDDFPYGTVGVPFITDCGHSLKFISGFIGVNQEMSDGEAIVSPLIGWAIIDDDSNDPSTEENYWVAHNERIKDLK